MASPNAIAEKQGRATSRINAAIIRLAAIAGVALPPPVTRSGDSAFRAAVEAERIADFLESLADRADGGRGVSVDPAAGCIRDGYNHTEAMKQKEQEERARERKGVARQPAPQPQRKPEEDEVQPVLFAGKPLAAFDTAATIEDLLKIEGVDEATAKAILVARADRDASKS